MQVVSSSHGSAASRAQTSVASLTQPSAAALRHGIVPMPNLAWTPEVARETAHLYEKVKSSSRRSSGRSMRPMSRQSTTEEAAQRGDPGAQLHDAGDLPRRRRLRRRQPGTGPRRRRTDAAIIVQAGVHFMAETSKVLSPDKKVLIPDLARRLLAGRLDHRRRRAAARAAISRRAGRDLRQHLGRVKAEVGHLLHLANAVEVVEASARRR